MDASPVPGVVVAHRYRLLQRRPSESWSSAWRAHDLSVDREVELVLVRIDVLRSRDPRPDAIRRYIDATVAATTDRTGPLSRILDVVVATPYVVVAGESVTVDEPAAAPIREDEASPRGQALTATPRARALTAAAGTAILGVFGLIGWLVSTTMFGTNYGEVSNEVSFPALSIVTSSRTAISDQAATSDQPITSGQPPQQSRGPILPTGAEIWSDSRAPDNADYGVRAVDADSATAWSTDAYRSPFRHTSNGIGIVVYFADAVDIGAVWIASPDLGTTVEIRTPPAPDGTLASTRVLGSAVLRPGVTVVPVDVVAGLRSVLVWVAELSPSGADFASTLSEVGFDPP